MIPRLFAENSNTFTSNGIGALSDVISCVVTEERNGQFELTMVYPADGKHFSDITLRSIIVADASKAQTRQPFRIYKISKPISGRVTIEAQHISYDLSKNVSMPFSVAASSSACSSALAGLKTNAVETCPFTFATSVTTVASFSFGAPASIRQMLGGVAGSVLDQFGGEYKFDKFNVSLLNSRGQLKNIPLKYGKNITDIKQEENIANTITGLVPFWADSEGGDVVTLTEKVVHASTASAFSDYLTVPIDFSSDFEEKPTENQLRAHTTAYINKNNIGVPKVSIDVSFVNLPDTEEYKGLFDLQNLELCDTIPVEFEKLGIETTAKVVKTEYNVLKNRYDKITVGTTAGSLAQTITGVSDSVATLANTTKTNFAKENIKVTEEIDNATAWMTATGGVIRALKNSDNEWTDILCCSATATATSGNVLRFNVNGIGFSSTGWNGTFTQAWTLDGRLVIGGTNVPSITVYDNSTPPKIIFHADATTIKWSAQNTTLDEYGRVTFKDASNNRIEMYDAMIRFYSAGYGQSAGYMSPAKYRFGLQDAYGIGLSGLNTFIRGDNKTGIISTDNDVFVDSGHYMEIWADEGDGYIGINGKLSTATLAADNTQIGVKSNYYVAKDGDYTFKDVNNVNQTLTFRNGLLVNTGNTWGYSNPTSYQIVFNANGGTGNVPPTLSFSDKDTETHDTTSAHPTRSDADFCGWAIVPDWSTTRVAYSQSAGGQPAGDWTTATITGEWTYTQWCNATGGSTAMTLLTLYAQWDEYIIPDEEEIIEES